MTGHQGEERVAELRVLLAGAGRAGMVHGRNFAAGVQGARLAGVADLTPPRASGAAELGCPAHADPVAAATDDGVDAVVIGAPTFAHAESRWPPSPPASTCCARSHWPPPWKRPRPSPTPPPRPAAPS